MTKTLATLAPLLWLLLIVDAAGFARAQSPSLEVVRHLPLNSNPMNPLTLGSDGHLYGTAQGTPGFIFRVTSGGAYTRLYTFPGPDNWDPSSTLVEGLDGHFYGTTNYGGIANAGTVYRLTKAGKVSFIHRFTAAEGHSASKLIRGSDGHLYGLMFRPSGKLTLGIVFKVTTTGTYTTLAILPTEWAEYPATLGQGPDGNFYGITSRNDLNSGRLFRLTPAGVFTSLATLANTERSSLMLGSDGAFYGTGSGGGPSNAGWVFKATLAGDITTLVTFDQFNGFLPVGGLREGSDGLLYGTTVYARSLDPGTGQPVLINGTVFSMTKAGALTTLARFEPSDVNGHIPGGGGPYGGVAMDASGALWGTTSGGGYYDSGVVFRYGLPLPPLRIVTQPADVSARTGDTVRFKVVAQGSGKALGYQWLKNGKAIGNSSVVSGARTNTLTLSKVGLATAGSSYSVVVSEAPLRVTSRSAQLRVTFADDDKDGVSNDLDLYPRTARGDVVNKSGGSIAQLVPMSGPWKSFNQYLGALVKTVNTFRKAGLITAKEGSLIVLKAIASKSKVKIKG